MGWRFSGCRDLHVCEKNPKNWISETSVGACVCAWALHDYMAPSCAFVLAPQNPLPPTCNASKNCPLCIIKNSGNRLVLAYFLWFNFFVHSQQDSRARFPPPAQPASLCVPLHLNQIKISRTPDRLTATLNKCMHKIFTENIRLNWT